jgi:linoleoyl-CoA desaturase
MHGAYAGLPGAEGLTPDHYESLAFPFQSRTWRDAHRIHHASPSLLGQDPNTLHPLFRVHSGVRWRPWHLFNTFLGTIFVFECWAFDYDRFLKREGLRPPRDRGELRKFALFLGYQYLFFACLAGPRWKETLAGGLLAAIIRNFVFVALQTGSSVGAEVSARHALAYGRKSPGEWARFQVESSKNFKVRGFWKILVGGLDRHIEHHLYPSLPPNRYQALSEELRALSREHGVAYIEYPSLPASLRDSFTHLGRLSRPS